MASNTKTPVTTSTDVTITTPTPFTVGVVNGLSYLRAIAGFSCIIAPTFTGKLFQIPIVANSTNSILLRLFGVRDAVIGELLWTVRPRSGEWTKSLAAAHAEQKELKRILWANVATDGLDLACIAFALSKGALSKPAAACVGGGAATFLVMGLIALKEL
jgi:hypothetical protein